MVAFSDQMVSFSEWSVGFSDGTVGFSDTMVAVSEWSVGFSDVVVAFSEWMVASGRWKLSLGGGMLSLGGWNPFYFDFALLRLCFTSSSLSMTGVNLGCSRTRHESQRTGPDFRLAPMGVVLWWCMWMLGLFEQFYFCFSLIRKSWYNSSVFITCS